MILFLLPAVLASSASVIDLVHSNVYSNLKGIGIGKCEDKKLHPDEYLSLHSEHRSANFRDLWKGWCNSLSTPESFKAAKTEIGEEKFWKIVNGECLFLGPMKWMTSEDVKAVKCAPLLNVPSNKDTQYVVPDEAMLVALLDKNVEYKNRDSLSFLPRESKNLPLIEEYVKKLAWDHPHWEIFPRFYFTAIDVTRMMPPLEKLNAQNLPRVLRVLSVLMYISNGEKNEKVKNEAVRLLEASPLNEYADYLKNKPRSWEHFETAFYSIPGSDYLTRIAWASSNNKLLMGQPSSNQIKSWVERFPALHPNASVLALSGTRHAADVPVPEWFMVIAEDETLRDVVSSQLLSYSVEQQAKFLSWNSRVLPPKDEYLDAQIDDDFPLAFGSVLTIHGSDEKRPFPSILAYKMIVAKFETAIAESPPIFPLWRDVQIVEMALAYGFPLSLSPSSIDFLCDENNEMAFLGKHFFSNLQQRRGILEYMSSDSNSQKLSQVKASDEVIGLVEFCNLPLSCIPKKQLSAASTDHMMKYLRSQCFRVEPNKAHEISKSILTLDNQSLLALFKDRSEEDKEQILHAIPHLDLGLIDEMNKLKNRVGGLIAADRNLSHLNANVSSSNTQPKSKKVIAKGSEKLIADDSSQTNKAEKQEETGKDNPSELSQSESSRTNSSLGRAVKNTTKHVNELDAKANPMIPKTQTEVELEKDGYAGVYIIVAIALVAIAGGSYYVYFLKRKPKA